MKRALKTLRDEMSTVMAARDYGAPRGTLTDRLHVKVADKVAELLH